MNLNLKKLELKIPSLPGNAVLVCDHNCFITIRMIEKRYSQNTPKAQTTSKQ